MKMLLVACLAALASPALSKCVGSINVKDFGEVFIVAPDWSVGAVTIHDNGFTLRGNSRIYFASRCEDGWNGDMYAQVTSVTNMSRALNDFFSLVPSGQQALRLPAGHEQCGLSL